MLEYVVLVDSYLRKLINTYLEKLVKNTVLLNILFKHVQKIFFYKIVEFVVKKDTILYLLIYKFYGICRWKNRNRKILRIFNIDEKKKKKRKYESKIFPKTTFMPNLINAAWFTLRHIVISIIVRSNIRYECGSFAKFLSRLLATGATPFQSSVHVCSDGPLYNYASIISHYSNFSSSPLYHANRPRGETMMNSRARRYKTITPRSRGECYRARLSWAFVNLLQPWSNRFEITLFRVISRGVARPRVALARLEMA